MFFFGIAYEKKGADSIRSREVHDVTDGEQLCGKVGKQQRLGGRRAVGRDEKASHEILVDQY